MEITRKNAKSWSRMGPRAVYGISLGEQIKNDSRIYALSGDLGISSGLSRLMSETPERYLNVGIAEQNLISVSAGLAREGLIPFASSFAPFITHRCEDQIRMNMGYMHLNIKTVGLGAGISMSILGNSHYGLDDIAVMNAIPGMVILSPCDCAELMKCVECAAAYQGPVYIRLTGEPGMPLVYDEPFTFEIGKANRLRTGDNVMIIATGSMVYHAIEAADQLTESGINASVVDVHTIKPFDVSILDEMNKSCSLIVTIEEHSMIGGLGSIVSDYVSQKMGYPRVVHIGLPDEYVKPGEYSYMLNQYGLTGTQIAERIKAEYVADQR